MAYTREIFRGSGGFDRGTLRTIIYKKNPLWLYATKNNYFCLCFCDYDRCIRLKPNLFTYTCIIIWLWGLKNIHPKFLLFHSFWEMVFCANFSTHWLVATRNLRHQYGHCILTFKRVCSRCQINTQTTCYLPIRAISKY